MVRSLPWMFAVLMLVPPMLGSGTAAAAPRLRIQAEAYAGDPFGVGLIVAELPGSLEPPVLGWSGLGVSEKSSRVLYPAVDSQSLGGIVKDILGQSQRPAARLLGEVVDRSGKVRIYFLFLGRGPLELTVRAQSPYPVTVTPMESQAGFQRLLDAWWRSYTAGPGLLRKKPDYPPLVENYLRAMLARRLRLELPEPREDQSWQAAVARELSLLAGTESLRLAVQRQRFLKVPAELQTADQPLPPAIANPEPAVPEPTAPVEIEPLALRVPAECLYVRFGSFANFLWFQDTLERIGGDFQNLVASRGLDRGTRERFETQLATQTTALARLLGDTIIADVAIVGTDLFLQEGGAYGLLFLARSSMLLGTSLSQQREVWKKKIPGTTETRVKIGDRDVSLLASADGRVRSYHVIDGDYQFVTTSKTLARRFLETGSGKGSLGASREFRNARTVMPLGRKDTVLAYLSSAFFQNLISPAYRVEMMRRLEAQGDIELVQAAVLASATEGKPGGTIDELVAGGFLPPGFGPRPDGSRAVLESGRVRDSLRGERGTFLPIPDVEVAHATRSEAAAYQQLADLYRSQWGQLDPVLAAIQRQPLEKDRDRVTIDLRMTPLARQHIELLGRFVGQADKLRVTPVPDDSFALEVILPRQRIFGGLQQVGQGLEGIEGWLLPFGRLRNLAMGYVGSTEEGGLLSWIPFHPVGPPDPEGYTRGEAGLWQRKTDRFTVFSFQRDVLERATSRLGLEETDRPAQVRLRISDLSKSPLASFLNGWGYRRTRETSEGNVRLLHQVTEQLHVPADMAKTAAEMLLDAKLICPLGGQYVYRPMPEGVGYWTSTALEGTRRPGLLRVQAPEGYLAPPLNWFRGLSLDAALADSSLAAHIELDMQWPAKRPGEAPKTGK